MNSKLVHIIERDIVRTLRLPMEMVFEFKVDQGINYLEKTFPVDHELAAALKNSKSFWNWWRSLWANRDKKLIAMLTIGEHGFSVKHPERVSKSEVWQHRYIYDWSSNVEFYQQAHINSLIDLKLYPNEEVINSALEQESKACSI